MSKGMPFQLNFIMKIFIFFYDDEKKLKSYYQKNKLKVFFFVRKKLKVQTPSE